MLKSTIVLVCAVFSAVLAGLFVIDKKVIASPQSRDQGEVASVIAAPGAFSSSTEGRNIDHVTAIPKGADGHFWIEARVNSSTVKFLVDTGATVVALTPQDAQRLGIDLKALIYDRKVSTANGPTQAAKVSINSIVVGQSTVRNVEALVIKSGLNTSLLGMSYLGRLRRFEATPSSLILHP